MDRVVEILKERGATVATAESCTGGRVAAAFTASAGASDYFVGGVVAYSNEVKIGVLGVERETIERHGAVSREVAEQMATGVRRLTGADYAIATTGIAGPGGGTSEKPVGTVWVAVSAAVRGNIRARRGSTLWPTTRWDRQQSADGTISETVEARLFNFDGTRTENMSSAVEAAIEMLRKNFI